MDNNILVYTLPKQLEPFSSTKEIRIMLFFPKALDSSHDTAILYYPDINFEHPKLIKPFLKEKNLIRKLDKYLMKNDIYSIAWALSKIYIATFVNITPSTLYVADSFIILPSTMNERQLNSLNNVESIFREYQNIEGGKVLSSGDIIPVQEINNGETLLRYINKEKDKVYTKRKDNHV